MKTVSAFLLVSVIVPGLAPAAPTLPPKENHVYDSGRCGVSFEKRDGTWCDLYWARDRAGKWQLLLAAPDSPKTPRLPGTLGGLSAGPASGGLGKQFAVDVQPGHVMTARGQLHGVPAVAAREPE